MKKQYTQVVYNTGTSVNRFRLSLEDNPEEKKNHNGLSFGLHSITSGNKMCTALVCAQKMPLYSEEVSCPCGELSFGSTQRRQDGLKFQII